MSEQTGMQPAFFDGADGQPRAWRAWEAASPQAALLVVHGLSEHSGRYARFAALANAAGISVYALDLAGHGLSGGRRGHVSSFDVHTRDIDALRRIVARRAGGVPLFLLGQSMGGLIVLRYLLERAEGISGAVLCSPWLGTAAKVPRWKTLLAPVALRFAPWLPFRHGLDPRDLSRDQRSVTEYEADPLVQHYITPRTFAEVNDAMQRVESGAGRFALPLLFLAGDDDHVVETARTQKLVAALPPGDVDLLIRAGGYHELLHEPDGDDVARVITGWITTRS